MAVKSNWLVDIQSAIGGGFDVDEVPDGWKTLREISFAMKVPLNTAKCRIENAVIRGSILRKEFRIRLTNRITSVAHYKAQ